MYAFTSWCSACSWALSPLMVTRCSSGSRGSSKLREKLSWLRTERPTQRSRGKPWETISRVQVGGV